MTRACAAAGDYSSARLARTNGCCCCCRRFIAKKKQNLYHETRTSELKDTTHKCTRDTHYVRWLDTELTAHAQSEANAAGLIVCDPVDGCTGYGLTDMGRSQVQEVSYTLTLCQCKCALCVLQTCINLQSLLQSSPSSSPASDPTIVSSDFKRTSETAEIVRKHFQIESHVRYERALCERNFGDFNLTSQTN